MSDISTTHRNTIIGLMIIAGAINTIAYKFQNRQYVYEGATFKYFFHPYMQATTMFFGEFLSLVVFLIKKRRDPEGYKIRMLEAKSKGKETKMNKLLLAVPAFCDFVTSTLHYIALNFIPGSVYLMMRGGTIITTFVFSIIFLKSKVKHSQIAGAVLAFIGVLIVGASNIIFSGSGSGASDKGLQIMGYILVIASLFFNGFYFVFEQKLFSKYHLEPLEVVGYEGAFGLCIYAVILPIISFVPCTFGAAACVFSYQALPFLQKPGVYFQQAFSNGALLFFCILGIFSIATFNITGVTVTKHINALARSIGDVTRTILVWIIGIVVTVTLGRRYPNYRWEIVEGGAIAIQLLGFVILVFGNLVYNQIIKLPCLKEKEKKYDETLLESADSTENIHG